MPTNHLKRFPDRSGNNISNLYPNATITYCPPRILIPSYQLTYKAYRKTVHRAKINQALNLTTGAIICL